MGYQKSQYGLTTENMNSISARWRKEKKSGREMGFPTCNAFIQWSSENGYDYGKQLHFIDEDGPLSPENCQWRDAELSTKATAEKKRLEQQWNAFIEPIRLAACRQGLNPCHYCPANGTCNTICPLRAVYWDAGMEKLRRELGA